MGETIEQIVIEYLASAIEGLEVYAETPADPPVRYVLVRRAGGSEENRIRFSNIVTEALSRVSLLDAAELHEQVVAAMLEIRDSTPLFSCRLNNDYNATRVNSKEYAYQALWQAVL